MQTFKEYLNESPMGDNARIKLAEKVWGMMMRKMRANPEKFLVRITQFKPLSSQNIPLIEFDMEKEFPKNVDEAIRKLKVLFILDPVLMDTMGGFEHKDDPSAETSFIGLKVEGIGQLINGGGLPRTRTRSEFMAEIQKSTYTEQLIYMLDYGKIKNIFIHEYTHFLDEIRYKGKDFHHDDKNQEEGDAWDDKYFNSDSEYNAFYSQAIAGYNEERNRIRDMTKRIESGKNLTFAMQDQAKDMIAKMNFEAFFSYELRDIGNKRALGFGQFHTGFLRHLNNDKQRRMKKRLYKYWDEIIRPEQQKLKAAFEKWQKTQDEWRATLK